MIRRIIFYNCGRKARLTNEQIIELREIITSGDESYSIDDVQRIIKDTYDVKSGL